MTSINTSTSMTSEKIISSEELISMLKQPPPSIIFKVEDYSALAFENYTIVGDHIWLDESINVDLPLTFRNCEFKISESISFEGSVFNWRVLFEGCTFSTGISINKGIFKKELCFKYVHIENIHISSASFEKISISCYDIKEIWISGAKFDLLNIGEHLRNNPIGKVAIFTSLNHGGDIIVVQPPIIQTIVT